jgi:hypothetical protein
MRVRSWILCGTAVNAITEFFDCVHAVDLRTPFRLFRIPWDSYASADASALLFIEHVVVDCPQ